MKKIRFEYINFLMRLGSWSLTSMLIWLEKKMIALDDECRSVHRLKTSFLFNLWSWSNVHSTEIFYSLIDFVLDRL